MKRARGPCGAGDDTLLASVCSTKPSRHAVRCKEEDDRGCHVSLCCKFVQSYSYFVRLGKLHAMLFLHYILLML